MNDLLQTFQEVLGQHGLVPEEILADGTLHRCPTESKPRKLNGAYIAHLDKAATLWWCNWETDDQGTFCAEEKQTLSPAEMSAWRERQQSIRRQREDECTRRHAEAAQQARQDWTSARACDPNHPYLRRKGIPPLSGIRQARDGALLIPVLDAAGNLQSLQRISPDGTKRFLVGGKVQGGRFTIPGLQGKPIAICEGFATGASIHLAAGWTVYVAFSAHNMPVVAKSARDRFTDRPIIICGDNDEAGRKKGEEAARLTKLPLVVPNFTTGAGTDFNALHQIEGIEAVRSQLEAALTKQHGLVALLPWT
ncbi:toprim domain-containing protein [Desulfovibrio sp. ZJ369]|uniref:toprim domain-containing protein n=1 Tax=Desulfovibrio sp. ZJ369 TaxID=2709793 RepID=UPI001F150785|nr:toprim domain-containing protein [Desulfovibrio sp. ZJ369]